MYSSYIQEAAAAMADRMNQSPVPLYGSKLRLPNRQAVILLIKEIRKEAKAATKVFLAS